MMLRSTMTLIVMAMLAPLPAQLQAEEMIRPRGQAAYEAELKALNAKYGPQAKVSQLREQAQGTGEATDAVAAATEQAAVNPTDAAAPALRITLLPVGERQFMLAEEVYDGAALELHLAQMRARQPLDSVILLSDSERKIEIPHLLELARLGRELNIPALYQDGDSIKAIAGR